MNWVKWGGNSSPLFNPLLPFLPVSILAELIISKEEVLLNLVLLIHINTHSRMEINL